MEAGKVERWTGTVKPLDGDLDRPAAAAVRVHHHEAVHQIGKIERLLDKAEGGAPRPLPLCANGHQTANLTTVICRAKLYYWNNILPILLLRSLRCSRSGIKY